MPTPPIQHLLALVETADSDIRRHVWPSLRALHADDPQAHQQALAALTPHHHRLRSVPYRVHADSIAAVRAYAPFTAFELLMEPDDDVADSVAYCKAHSDIEHIAMVELEAQAVCEVIRTGTWRGIALEACSVDDVTATALFEHPGSNTLQTLRVAEGWSAPSFVDAMTASPHLSGLRDLALTFQRAGVEFFSALAAWPQLGRLQALDMRNCRLGAEGTAALVDLPVPPTLHHLHLGSNELGDEGLHTLVSSGWLRDLRVLLLGGDAMGGTNGIGDEGVAALSHHLGSVEVLDLAGNDISDAGARALARAALPRLETLRLGSNNLGDAGAIALIRSGNLPNLRHLDLSHNVLSDAFVDVLLDTSLLQLRTITLTWNACSSEGLAALRRAHPRLCTTSVWSS